MWMIGLAVTVSLIVGFLVGALVMHNNYASFHKTYKSIKEERDKLLIDQVYLREKLGIK